jgi:hypothetical protein
MSISNEKNTETECLIELVKRRYGDQLNPEQMADVEKTIKDIRKMTDALGSVTLKNSDEPITQFIPYSTQDD